LVNEVKKNITQINAFLEAGNTSYIRYFLETMLASSNLTSVFRQFGINPSDDVGLKEDITLLAKNLLALHQSSGFLFELPTNIAFMRNTVLPMLGDQALQDKFKTLILRSRQRFSKVEEKASDTTMVRMLDAIHRGDVTLLKALIKEGVDINQPFSVGKTPLTLSVQSGDVKMVGALIAAGSTQRGADLLLPAISSGNTALLHYLIEQKVDLEPQASSDLPAPLMLALQIEDNDMLKILLEAGANPNKADKDGVKPLVLAVQKGDPEVIMSLLEVGADIRVGDPVLSSVAKMAGHEELVEYLGVLEGQSETPNYPLFIAILRKDSEAVTHCLEQSGFDVNGEDAEGNTPIELAIKSGEIKVVEALLEKGVTASQPALLFPAILDNNADMIQLLREHKVGDGMLDFPLKFAVNNNKGAAVKSLLATGAKANTELLSLALQKCDSDVIFALIEENVSLASVPNEEKNIILNDAVKQGKVSVVEAIFKSGVDVENVEALREDAAKRDDSEVLKVLNSKLPKSPQKAEHKAAAGIAKFGVIGAGAPKKGPGPEVDPETSNSPTRPK